MDEYYTREMLGKKVKLLEQLTGKTVVVLKCGQKVALNGEGVPFWAGWYRTVRDMIIYLEGLTDGLKHSEQ